MGPDPTRPPAPIKDGATLIGDDGKALEPETIARRNTWWRRFADPPTQDIVRTVLAGNYDARAAAARVLRAQAELEEAGGRLLPRADASAEASRQRRTFTLPSGEVDITDETFRVGATVSWEVDLWGKLRRARQAAAAQLLASEADRRALLHSLVAQAIRSRVRLAELGRRVRIAEENVRSRRRTLEAVEARYLAGLVDAASLRLARQNLAAARRELPALRTSRAQAVHALDVLRGIPPGEGGPPPAALEGLPPLEPPPAGLPAALLDRRPDLLASDFRARAAAAGVGVEIADLLPSLTLTGSTGLDASELDEVLSADAFVYTLAAELAAPIFTSGVERAQIDVARAEAQVQAAEYAGLVLQALQEVEDALVADAHTRRRLERAGRAFDEARQAEALARDRYERGVGELLQVFEAERQHYQSHQQAVRARADVWTARVDLHLALGGDWKLEGPPPMPEPEQWDEAAAQRTEETRPDG